jgi:hypothetical protein
MLAAQAQPTRCSRAGASVCLQRKRSPQGFRGESTSMLAAHAQPTGCSKAGAPVCLQRKRNPHNAPPDCVLQNTACLLGLQHYDKMRQMR